jgi:endonuclease/exonuclease/phosphatase family metal-dependent hydrolase
MDNNELKILTYNIHKGFHWGNRRFVLHQIRDALQSTRADLLFLQEMQGEHDKHRKKISEWPNRSQFEFLAEGAWPYYIYGKNAVYSAGHHGNAILSKFPFQSWENINVSPFPWASRSLLHGVIAIPNNGLIIHIVCIHLGLTAAERRQQIAKLCDRIENHVPQTAPLIVAGDFNDWLVQADHLFHSHLGLQEVFHRTHGHHAKTFPVWLPFLAMDRIYYRGLIPKTCERYLHNPWHTLSDHVPLTATFSYE